MHVSLAFNAEEIFQNLRNQRCNYYPAHIVDRLHSLLVQLFGLGFELLHHIFLVFNVQTFRQLLLIRNLERDAKTNMRALSSSILDLLYLDSFESLTLFRKQPFAEIFNGHYSQDLKSQNQTQLAWKYETVFECFPNSSWAAFFRIKTNWWFPLRRLQ